jgi:hypothetical protein
MNTERITGPLTEDETRELATACLCDLGDEGMHLALTDAIDMLPNEQAECVLEELIALLSEKLIVVTEIERKKP